jgi:hypothetical protein
MIKVLEFYTLLGMGQESDDIDGDKIEKGNVTADKQHGNDDDQGRIPEFLVFFEAALAVIPRPLNLRQFRTHFTEVVCDFITHGKNCDCTKDAEQARRDSNPQQTVLETATLPIELLA